jgi:hypothetical protein
MPDLRRQALRRLGDRVEAAKASVVRILVREECLLAVCS